MTDPRVEIADRKVMMSRALMDLWASRDLSGDRLSWDWGEPDADGFYTPTVVRDPDDNLVVAALERLRAVGTSRIRREGLREVVSDGIEAFRLTREYVGAEMLPALPGWSWFDWTEKARAALADRPSTDDGTPWPDRDEHPDD